MRFLLVITLFLLAILGAPRTWGAPLAVINAGFIDSLTFRPAEPTLGDTIRVYGSIQNNAAEDLVGTVRLFHNDKSVAERPISVTHGTTLDLWFDVDLATTTNRLYAQITSSQQSVVDQPPIPVAVQFSVSPVLTIRFLPAPAPPSSTLVKNQPSVSSTVITSPSSSNNVQATSSSRASGEVVAAPASSSPAAPSSSDNSILGTWGTFWGASASGSAVSTTVSSTLGRILATTKNVIETVSGRVVPFLKVSQTKIDEERKIATSSEPLPLLSQGADALEKKSTFLKIPRDQLPGVADLKSWGLALSIRILNTWWIMLIIYALIFRALYKLWRRGRRTEETV